MAKKRKLTRKELLSSDDKFITLSEKVFQFLFKHAKKIGYFAGILLIVIVSVLFWKIYSKKIENKALASYYQGVRLYQKGDEESGNTENKDENSRLAQEVFKETAKKYPRTQAGKLALLYSGNCYYQLKDYDNAGKSFQEFLNKSSEDSNLKVLALNSLGQTYEAQKKYQKALECFERIVEGEKESLGDVGYLSIARCHEELKQKDKAIEAYQEILSSYPDSTFADFVEARLAKLRAG